MGSGRRRRFEGEEDGRGGRGEAAAEKLNHSRGVRKAGKKREGGRDVREENEREKVIGREGRRRAEVKKRGSGVAGRHGAVKRGVETLC